MAPTHLSVQSLAIIISIQKGDDPKWNYFSQVRIILINSVQPHQQSLAMTQHNLLYNLTPIGMSFQGCDSFFINCVPPPQ